MMRICRMTLVGCLLPLCLTLSQPEVGASDWPQWRGPGGTGVSSESSFPDVWGPDSNLSWKTPIPGRGHSSPVVWGDRVFVTTAIRGTAVSGASAVTHYRGEDVYKHPQSEGADHWHQLRLISLDRNTGKVVWSRTAWEGNPYDNRHRQNTYASGTPVTDGRHVYAFFDSEGIYCYDFDGRLVWKRSLAPIAKAGMGYGMSPVLFQNLLILQVDKQGMGVTTDPRKPVSDEGREKQYGENSFIAALDKKTGRTVWKTVRNHRRSWATPLLVSSGNRTELISSGAESVISYDPRTGQEIWRAPGVRSHPIPSPVTGNGMVFLTAGSGKKVAMAIRLGGSGDLTDTSRIAWTYDKGTAYVPSPILVGDYLYLFTDKGIVTCLEASSGRVVYTERLPVAKGFRSSPVSFDDKILFVSEEGEGFMLKTGPQFEVVQQNSLGETVWASPALSDGQILIRGAGHLFCFQER